MNMDDIVKIYEENKINNIIDNDDFLKEVLSAGYYKLTRGGKRDTTIVEKKELEDFYVKMTNKWAKQILATPETHHRYKEFSYDVIQKIITEVGTINTIDDVKILIDKLQQNNINKHAVWATVQSGGTTGLLEYGEFYHDYLHVCSNDIPNIPHFSSDISERFYINCENKDIMTVVNKYVDYCEQANIPYYIKFTENGSNDNDKIVCYTTKEYIKQNIAIFNNMYKELSNIDLSRGEVSPAVVKINDLVSYAMEPDKKYLTSTESFHSLREKILNEAKKELVNNFLNEIVNNKKESEIADKVFPYVKEGLDDQIDYYINGFLRHIPEYESKSSTLEQAKKLKSVIDLYNSFDKDSYYKYIKENMASIITKTFTHDSKEYSYLIDKNQFLSKKTDELYANAKLNDVIEVRYSNIETALGKAICELMPNAIEEYRKIIKNNCLKYGVDPTNFAFNLSVYEEMQKNNNNQVNNNVSQDDEPQVMDPEAQSIIDEFNTQTKAEGQTQGDAPQTMDPEAQSIIDEFNTQTKAEGQTQGDEPQAMDPEAQSIVDDFNSQIDNKAQDDEPQTMDPEAQTIVDEFNSQTDNKAQDDAPQQDNNVVQNDAPQVVQQKEKYTMSEIMIYIHENIDKEFDRDKLAKVFNKSPLAISSAYNYVVQNYDLLTERINNMNSSKDNTANTITR
jgi:hypothetical protein